jgi:hypothetical protein
LHSSLALTLTLKETIFLPTLSLFSERE